MDFKLSQDQRLLTDSVMKFASLVKAAAPKIDLDEKMDAGLFKGAAELGLPLDAVPASHGGYLEGTYSHLSRILRGEILGAACAGVAHQIESATDAALAIGRAPTAVQAKWFPKFSGTTFATAALLGKRDGFKAVQSGAGYTLTGSETTVLLAESARIWVIKAAGPGGNVLALLPGKGNAETFRVSNTGFRACDAADVHMTDVAVGADDVIATGASADALWKTTLDGARISLAARAVGTAQAAIDFAQQYASERIQFGRPIAKFQSLAQMIEESTAAIAAARLLVQQIAFRLDAGEAVSDDIRKAKAHVSRVLTRATTDAVQILGGYGFVNDYPVEKYYRDARVYETLYGRDILDLVLQTQAA